MVHGRAGNDSRVCGATQRYQVMQTAVSWLHVSCRVVAIVACRGPPTSHRKISFVLSQSHFRSHMSHVCQCRSSSQLPSEAISVVRLTNKKIQVRALGVGRGRSLEPGTPNLDLTLHKIQRVGIGMRCSPPSLEEGKVQDPEGALLAASLAWLAYGVLCVSRHDSLTLPMTCHWFAALGLLGLSSLGD